MKRFVSFVSIIVLLFTMTIVPSAFAASSAQTFANKASAEIGKTGSYYGYTDEWCARAVKRWADQAGLGSNVPAQYNTAAMARWFHQNGNRFALTRRNSSGTIECWTRGTWSSSRPSGNYNFTPAVGDIVFFETNGSPADGIDHVGVVVGVSGNNITVVEGNTGSSNNSKSYVSKNTYNWKQNNSKVWGFARPKGCGSMPSASGGSSSTKLTAGPKLSVLTNARSASAVIKWSAVPGADSYGIELYDAAGWKKHQNGANQVYLQKKYTIRGTTYTFSGLMRNTTYYVQAAAVTKSGEWKFGPVVSFKISASGKVIILSGFSASN